MEKRAHPVNSKQRKVAVFDVDGTIFRSSLLIELVEEMVQLGFFPPAAKRGYERQHKKWLERKDGYEPYIHAVVDVFEKHLKGVHYGDFADVAKRVVKDRQHYVYRYTRDLIGALKRREYFLVAISQSPKTALDPFCHQLGFDKVYGRIYEIGPEDRFTGKVEDVHLIANKLNVLHRVLERENLTTRGSIGVGDTEGDISFLEAVEQPLCFNPNATLYRHAKRMGWKVVVERKDVIYEL